MGPSCCCMQHGCLSSPGTSPASPAHASPHLSSVEISLGLQEARYAQGLKETRNKGGRREKEQNDRTRLTDSEYTR